MQLGRPLTEECAAHGVAVEDYLARYDPAAVAPFPGVSELLGRLDRWAVCSHKQRASGQAELNQLGWTPDAALFADDFAPGHKSLTPVLDLLDVTAQDAVFIGDTAHDRACARADDVPFVLAGWNGRVEAEAGDIVVVHPGDVLHVLAGRVFHLALAAQWDPTRAYEQSTIGRTLADVGFIHCSFAHQVQAIADAAYRGRADVVLLEIALDRVATTVRVESLEGGDNRFPHVYGSLVPDAVMRATPVTPGEGGRLRLGGLFGSD